MASSLAIVRTLIQDNTVPYILSDDDINAIVLLEPNAFRAAATAARAASGSFSEQVDMGGGSSKLSLSQKAKAFLDLAEQLDQRAQQGGDGGTGVSGVIVTGAPEVTGISNDAIQEEREDTDRYDSSFYRGINDNPSGSYDNDEEY